MMKLKAIWFAVTFRHGLFSRYAFKGGESGKGKSGQIQSCGRVCQAIRGWHGEKSIGLCRVGHKVLPGERFTNSITKAQGDSILRADLRKLCRMFSYLGRDSLIVSVLAYNVGCSRIKGYGKIPKSRLLKNWSRVTAISIRNMSPQMLQGESGSEHRTEKESGIYAAF